MKVRVASFTDKIALAAVAVTMVIVILFGTVSYYFMRASTHRQIHARVSYQRNFTADRIEDLLDDVLHDLKNVSENLVVVNALIDSAGREIYAAPFFRSYELAEGLPFVLTLCDFEGKPILSNGDRPPSFRDSQYTTRLVTEEKPLVRLIFGEEPSHLHIAYPVFYRATGMAEGFVVLELSLADLVDAAMGHEPVADGEHHLQILKEDEVVWEGGIRDGSDMFSVAAPLELPPPLDTLELSFEYAEYAHEAYAPLRRLQIAYAIAAVAVLLLTLVISRIAAGRLAGPIIQLSNAAEEVARRGSPDVTIEIDSNDEVGVLARSLRTMLDRLRESRDQLERRVADRTSELTAEIAERKQAEESLRESEARFRSVVEQAGDAVFLADISGRLIDANDQACAGLGYSREELLKMGVTDLDPEFAGQKELSAFWKTLVPGEPVLIESRHRRKDGTVFPVEISTGLIEAGEKRLVLGMVRDITDRKRREELVVARMKLNHLAAEHSSAELLRDCLDEAERLTGSEIGFFHYFEPDEERLHLQAWSTNTVEKMCTAEGAGSHYPLNEAGVWVDCIRAGRPEIHNDYASLPHRKGLPEGHAPVMRELTVPVVREGRIIAILGVGNKKSDYLQEDVERVSALADEAWDIVSRKRAEESLSRSEERYRTTITTALDGFWQLDLDGRFLDVNVAYCDLVGYTREEFLSMHISDIEASEDASQIKAHLEKVREEDGDRFETRHRAEDGRVIDVEVSARYSVEDSCIFCFIRDITERRQAEEERKRLELQLLHTQKMEAIGTLAGGIAHDFNNILGAILGYAELSLLGLDDRPEEKENVREVLHAAKRAKELVKQILTFSRRPSGEIKPVSIHLVVSEAIQLLRQTIPANIPLSSQIDKESGRVLADPTQIHQVVMNLCTNAYHALREEGGELSVELDRVEVGLELASRIPDLREGMYARLTVSDTGTGMPPEVVARVFEPFFTTKPQGQGTGMGLSVVHGIVRSTGGAVEVESRLGEGTVFRVFFPLSGEGDPVPEGPLPLLPRGEGRVLVVDDEPMLVDVAAKLLEKLGYSTLRATSAAEALSLFSENPRGIDLVLTDMTMPEMTGIALTKRLQALRPDIPVVLCTGYSEFVDEASISALGARGLIMKPLGIEDLARTMASVLGKSRAESEPKT